jgi:hypothetical protein
MTDHCCEFSCRNAAMAVMWYDAFHNISKLNNRNVIYY